MTNPRPTATSKRNFWLAQRVPDPDITRIFEDDGHLDVDEVCREAGITVGRSDTNEV